MKLQSSVEFFVTYSWVLLILSAFIATVAVISLSRPVQTYIQSQCSITPLFPCLDTVLTTSPSTTFTLLFQNNLGQALYFPSSAFNVLVTNTGFTGAQYNIGSCAPSLLPVGGEAVCNAIISGNFVIPPGAQTLATFIITYELCNGGTVASCSSSLYKTTGSAIQSVSPSGTSLYSVNFQVSGSAGANSGMIVLNGVSYPNSDTAYFANSLSTGNYIIFAQPALGHSFVSWSATVPSTVASTATQNTVLLLTGNTVLTATFT